METAQVVRIPEIEGLFPKPLNYEEIKTDIAARGIQEALVVNPQKELICGYTRLSIAEDLRIDEIPHRVVDITDTDAMIEYAVLDNIRRRQLTDLQLVEYGMKLEEIYGKRQGERTDLGTDCPEVGKGRTRDFVAAKIQQTTGAKMSGRKYDRLKTLAAKAVPEVKRKLNQGEVSQQAALDLCRFEPETQSKFLLETDLDTVDRIFGDAFQKIARGNVEHRFVIEIFQLIPVSQSLVWALHKEGRSKLELQNCCAAIDLRAQRAMGEILNRRKLWVQFAAVPQEVLERYFVGANQAGEEITREALLRSWDQAEGGRLSKGRISGWHGLIQTARWQDQADNVLRAESYAEEVDIV